MAKHSRRGASSGRSLRDTTTETPEVDLEDETAAAELAAMEEETETDPPADDDDQKLKQARELLVRHLGSVALVDALEAFIRAVK